MSVSKIVAAAASSAGGAGLDVDEVFSCHLYDGTGTGSNLTVTNNIDLSTEGGLVWVKNRDATAAHALFDTVRGQNILESQSDGAQDAFSAYGGSASASYNTNGFGINGTGASNLNESGVDYVSWTFRKAPKFFDIVTYTGNGNNGRAIAHNLDHEVGFIMVRRTDASEDWVCYHRGIVGSDDTNAWQYTIPLNGNNARYHAEGGQGVSWSQKPTTTHFYVDDFGAKMNESGASYVAYLFAHNNNDGEFGPDSDQDIIKCGSYTGNNSTTGPVVNVGFEPQWLMIKSADGSENWQIFDSMRGMPVGGRPISLYPNLSNAEDAFTEHFDITPTGFQLKSQSNRTNASGSNYIYMAIRRGPLAVPDDATKVFGVNYAYTYDVDGNTGGSSAQLVGYLGEPADLNIQGYRSGSSYNAAVYDRLRNNKYLITNTTSAEASVSGNFWDNMTGFREVASAQDTTLISWTWKRAPGYFDVVCYDGNSTNGRELKHNLGVVPEMVWTKARSDTKNWIVYHSALGNTNTLSLNTTGQADDESSGMQSTPTATSLFLNGGTATNSSSQTYIAYLFATVAGVSKVGSYTGNDTGQNIDCGFSSGARFVLIKCSSHGDRSWMVFDSVRGIVAGADPFLALEDNSAEYYASNGAGSIQNYTSSNLDLIDPYSSGFAVVGGTGMVNGNGKTYIFYAIA